MYLVEVNDRVRNDNLLAEWFSDLRAVDTRNERSTTMADTIFWKFY